MKLMASAKSQDWQTVFEDTVQVDYAPIPTGEVIEVINEDGQKKKQMVTQERAALGFQTETGRGKGVQWVPVEDIPSVLDRLGHYSKEGVENIVVVDEWLSPAESIDETIAKVPRLDGNGNKIEGAWDISFRVRMGKGSKSCRVPEEDFATFVSTLKQVAKAVPDAIAEVDALRAKAAAKAAEKAAKAGDNSGE